MRKTHHKRKCAYCPRKVDRDKLADGVCFDCQIALKSVAGPPQDHPDIQALKDAWAIQDKRNKNFGGGS